MNLDVNLSDSEIANICSPLTQNAAIARHLKTMGLVVQRKPNGRPLVNRAHYNEITGSAKQPSSKSEPMWKVRK